MSVILNTGKAEDHYAITDRFVQKYMTFSKGDSFWYVSASGAGRADGFQKACFKNGLSVFAGWTLATGSIFTELKLFDRLLGANSFQAEDPPQRPFDWPNVWVWMDKQGLSHGLGGSVLKFVYMEGKAPGDYFGLLNPTISGLGLDSTGHLLVFGLFGDDPGSGDRHVTMKGTGLNVIDWQPEQITCDVGPDATGDVQVSANGHDSNKVALTMYQGTVHYKSQGGHHFAKSTPDNAVFDVTMNVRFRMSLQPSRTAPGEAPKTPNAGGGADSSSTFSWQGSGTKDYGNGNTIILSGRGTDSFGTQRSRFSVSLDGATNKVSFFFTAVHGAAFWTTQYSNGQPSPPTQLLLSAESAELGPKVETTMSSDFTIKGNSITYQTPVSSTLGGTYQTTLQWDDMKPTDPPDPQSARSANQRRAVRTRP